MERGVIAKWFPCCSKCRNSASTMVHLGLTIYRRRILIHKTKRKQFSILYQIHSDSKHLEIMLTFANGAYSNPYIVLYLIFSSPGLGDGKSPVLCSWNLLISWANQLPGAVAYCSWMSAAAILFSLEIISESTNIGYKTK